MERLVVRCSTDVLLERAKETESIHAPTCPDDDPAARSVGQVDVVGERTFDSPITLDELAALERSCAWCAKTHGVKLMRLILSHDGRRAVGLLRAPDAESVRLAYRHAALFDRVWVCPAAPVPAAKAGRPPEAP